MLHQSGGFGGREFGMLNLLAAVTLKSPHGGLQNVQKVAKVDNLMSSPLEDEESVCVRGDH